MELKGKVLRVQESGRGTSAKGDWVKHTILAEYGDTHVKQVAFTLFNKQNVADKLTEGSEAVFHFDVESREYNDRFYTDIKVWKVEDIQGGASPAPYAPAQPQAEATTEEEDDLPF